MTVKMVQGVVQRISIKPIANGPDRFDNNFRKSFQIDDVWYSMGGAKTDKWNVKMGNDFKVLGVGSEVAFKAEQSGDFWNGKSMMVLNLVEGDNTRTPTPSANQSSEQKPAYQPKPKFDATGVSTGQSVNGALNFILTFGLDASNENIVKYGKLVHSVTEKVKEYVKTVNPDATEYEQGARGGLAVLSACKLVGTEQDFEVGVEYIAKDLVDNVFPPIMDFVKGGVKEEAPPVKVTRASPAKKPATKAPAVAKKEPVMPPLEESFDDLEDSVPF